MKADADELPGDARVFEQAQVISTARPVPARCCADGAGCGTL